MARRHENNGIIDLEEARRSRKRRRRSRKFKEYKEELKDAMTPKYNEKQKLLVTFHLAWRIINWLIVILLANQAFGKILKWMKTERTFRPKLIFFAASLGIAVIMIVFAEGTSHDKLRRRAGQIIAVVSEGIMLTPVLVDLALLTLMGLINSLTNKIAGSSFNVQNYQDSNLGWLWPVNLFLTVVVCVSLLKEEQSTDKRLGFARTPQKKDITDYGVATDEDGRPILRVKKYKQ